MFLSEKLNAKSVLVMDIGPVTFTLTTTIFTSIARIKFIVHAHVVLAKPKIKESADTNLEIIVVVIITKRLI